MVELEKIDNWELAMEDTFQPTPLTGKYLEKAEIGFNQTAYQSLVLLQFNSEGSKIFADLKTLPQQCVIYKVPFVI